MISAKQIAEHLQAPIKGNADVLIHGVASLTRAESGLLSFCATTSHRKTLTQTKASLVLIPSALQADCPQATTAIIVTNPRLSFAKIIPLIYPVPARSPGIHTSAIVGENCQISQSACIGEYAVVGDNTVIGDHVSIGAGCMLGKNVHIGDHTRLQARVTLYDNVFVGQRTIIHSGSVLGADGFGFEHDETGHWVKIPQLGRVCVGDDVEIGANTCIDCGALEDTMIGNGVKLDDQVMIGHNVQIGDHTLIAGCSAVAGSTVIGKHCLIAGGVCIADHLQLVDGTVIAGMAGVRRSIGTPGAYASGTPLQDLRQWRKNSTRYQTLDKLAKRVKQLEDKQDK